MKQIFNHSKLIMEPARLEICPRCNGYGKTLADYEYCGICDGNGEVWLTDSNWTLRKYGRVGRNEQLY